MDKRRHCVPAWEREFTFKVGGLAWERFLEAKKHVDGNSKVMEWNDSAGKKAFHEAKIRFCREYNHPRFDEIFSDPYVCIDNNFDQDSNPRGDGEDENLMSLSKEEFSENGGISNRILDFMLHPVVKVKRYAAKNLASISYQGNLS